MSASQPLLAMFGGLRDLVSGWRVMNAAVRENIAVFGALAILTAVVMIWAACFRKTKRRRKHHSHRPPQEWGKNQPGWNGDGPVLAALTGRKRRRRRDHRPRNPTLAETGGMPPTRIQESLPPET